MRKQLAIRLLLAVLVAGAGACDEESTEPRICTDLDCESGLGVEVEGSPADSFRISAHAEGEETRSVVCADGLPCEIFFEDFTPLEVEIHYREPGFLVTRTFSPEYERSLPNGEACPPECWKATVVLEVPTIGRASEQESWLRAGSRAAPPPSHQRRSSR